MKVFKFNLVTFILTQIVLILGGQFALANVKVLVSDCSGTLIKMPGMGPEQKGLVLTSGHCIGVGSFNERYPDDKEIFINFEIKGRAQVRSSSKPLGKSYSYSKIIWATMTGVDIALIELDVSIGLIEKEGFRFYEPSEKTTFIGQELHFSSANKGYEQKCNVEDYVPILKEGPWTFHNALRASIDCQFIHGQSGTAGIDPIDGRIYAIAQTIYEGNEPCSLGNPCEVKESNQNIVRELGRAYLAPVDILFKYYNFVEKRFEF